MNPEDRLRDAAKSYTDPIQPAPGAWARVRERIDVEPRRSRRSAGRLALAGFATAVVIALVITLVAVVRDDDGGGERNIAADPRTASGPEQLVAATEDGRLVVLDSSTGAEIRELADDAATAVGAGNNVAVAPDGSAVYYARTIDVMCGGAPLTEVARVDVATGTVESVASAVRYPAMSPDGRLLAYTGIPNCSDAGRDILVQDLQTGEGKWFSTEQWPIQQGIGLLSWAADSRHLTFTPFDAPDEAFPRVLDTLMDIPLDEAPRVLNPDGSRITGYYGTNLFIGTRCSAPDEPSHTAIVTFAPTSGAIEQTLFRIPVECPVGLVATDSTGGSVLVVTQRPSRLYGWRVGEEPVLITDGIVAAAWLPDAQPPPGAPAEIVAATSDSRLVVMNAETGAVLRTLADGLGAGTTIAVTPDRERVFFDRPNSPESDPPRELLTVPTSGGEVSRLIGGAGQPAVSPDGRLLAFVRYQAPGLQVVEIPDTFDDWLPNVVGDGEISGTSQAVLAPSWAPDSRHLAYTVVAPDGSPPRVAELGYGIRLDAAPAIPVPVGSCAVTSYLGDTGLVAVAHGGDRAIAVDPASGEGVRELFRGPGLGCGADRPLASDRTGAHLLYVAPGATPELYRWSEGDAEPTKIADGITAAAWLTPPT